MARGGGVWWLLLRGELRSPHVAMAVERRTDMDVPAEGMMPSGSAEYRSAL